MATVYRDSHGVPHITAATEESAWYALGYEQARDGLLWIQYACKAAKGQLTWLRGDDRGVLNDLAVKIFDSHLGNKTPTQLRAMFSQGVNPAITANFYDNCVAFAAGADAFRQAVENAVAPSPEYDLKYWLDHNDFPNVPGAPANRTLAWVYQDTIEAVDILSQGGWTTATMSFVTYPMGKKFDASGICVGD